MVGVSGLVGLGAVSAQSDTSSDSGMSNLVDKIASKFNLDKTEVQKLFDQDRSEHEAARQQEVASRLDQLVKDGVITSSQKTAIEAKLKEMKSQREADKDSFKDLSEEERHTKMETKRTELERWAKEQGLDLTTLRGIFMGGRHGGPLPEGGSTNTN